MKQVWLVEQGDYSDYHVCGVFSSEANAKLIADAINAEGGVFSSATVSARELDPGVDALNVGHHRWRVLMLRDGTVEGASADIYGCLLDGGGESYVWRRSEAPAYRGKGIPDCLNATVWAKNKKHAVKIVNEMRAQWIADGRWS